MSNQPTPETDRCAESIDRGAGDYDGYVQMLMHARRLERQRDELLEIANRAVSELEWNLRCEETCKCSGRHQIAELQAAIAAVKGATT